MSDRVARDVDVPEDRPEIDAHIRAESGVSGTVRVRIMEDMEDMAPYLADADGGPSEPQLDREKVPDLISDWMVKPDVSRDEVPEFHWRAVEEILRHIIPEPPSRWPR